MQKILLKFLIFTSAWMLFFSSCKKEDTISPTVKIMSPSQDSQFNVGDTVFVSASISDNTRIAGVTVRLLNSNYISVGSDYPASVPSNNSVINVQYVIDNPLLISGNYFIAVAASDGHTETTEYVRIHLSEIPKVRKGIYLISASTNFAFQVVQIDSAHHPNTVINVNGDYAGSAVYSSGHELFTTGSITGSFNGFDLTNYSSIFTHPSISFPVPTFKKLFFEGDVAYVSYYDGNIRGFDKFGSQKYTVQQSGYFIPDVIFKNDQYLFAEIYYPTFHQNKIGIFYLVTGAEKQESNVDMDIKNIWTLDNTRLLVFGNDTVTGQGKIELYDILGNGITQMHTIPTGSLNQVIQVDNFHYLISHSGGIYMYDYSMNSLVSFITGLPVYAFEYDDLDQEIFATSGNQVNVYNSYTGLLNYSITNPDSVMDVRVLYNR